MGYIYMLKSPSGKIYIGQTIRPIHKRLEEHRKGQSSDCVAIYNAIQYHGWDNFEKDWYECPDEDLNFDEGLLVREMGTLSPGGYNLREGGGSSGKASEESKRKNSEAHRGDKNHMYGKTHYDETKRKNSEAQRGEKHHMYGKTHTEESNRKNSEAHIGEKNPMYGKTGEKHHRSKRVYQYDQEEKLLGSFGSAGEAGRYLEKAGSGISMCAAGDRKTAYGFKWSYININ
jgi:group I intron endonuclease